MLAAVLTLLDALAARTDMYVRQSRSQRCKATCRLGGLAPPHEL